MKRLCCILITLMLFYNSVFGQNQYNDTTRLKKWEFGVGLGAILCPLINNNKNTNIDYKSKVQFTPEVNFFAYYNFNKNWSLQSGLSFSLLKYKYKSNSNFLQKDSITSEYMSTPIKIDVLYDYFRICLPLYVQYSFRNVIAKNIDLYIKGGGELNFSKKYYEKTVVNLHDKTSTYEFYPKYKGYKLNPFKGWSDPYYYWSCGIYIGNKINLRKKIFLYYEVGANYGKRSLYGESNYSSFVKSTGLLISSNIHVCF